MKICCFISSLGPGGAERVMANLANYWVSQGQEVTIVTYDQTIEPFYSLDRRIGHVRKDLSGGRISKRLLNHMLRVPTFRSLIKKIHPDVVVSFMDRTNVLVLIALIGLEVPVIVSERTDPRFYYLSPLYHALRKILYQRASAVVALSTEQARWLSSFSKDVFVIPNPVLFSKNAVSGIERLEHRIVAAGRLVKHKGFDLLIQAFAQALDRNSNWILEIYGEGPERTALEKQVEALNLSKRVILPGLVDDLDLRLRKAQFFVLSSRLEGFPSVLLEALVNKCPPIAADCTDSIREIIEDGKNGIIVPPCNIPRLATALSEMMSNRSYRSELAANGPAILNKYNIQTVSASWERLFSRVAG